MIVHADLRWPPKTGIGAVQQALLDRKPASVNVIDLQIAIRIGSVRSPLQITRSLHAHGAARGDVFWSPGFVPPFSCPIPAVVTVHDLTHLHFYTRLHALYYEIIFKRLYRRCKAIICVSDYTRHEFLEWSGMPPEKVFTVHNGVAAQFFASGDFARLPFEYVFYPGNHRRYKNLERLLHAYAQSSLPRAGIHLVMTGSAGPELLADVRRTGLDKHVHFAGNVTDEALVGLYRGAILTAFASLYEGFGLPIIESMTAGTAVLTSNVAAMPEVAGDAALLVDPTSIAQIGAGLERLAFDSELRDRLVARGRVRAAMFDWNHSATAVWSIVVAAAGAKSEV
jgi:glycosyltransferase involved in cell wall biosynthesis